MKKFYCGHDVPKDYTRAVSSATVCDLCSEAEFYPTFGNNESVIINRGDTALLVPGGIAIIRNGQSSSPAEQETSYHGSIHVEENPAAGKRKLMPGVISIDLGEEMELLVSADRKAVEFYHRGQIYLQVNPSEYHNHKKIFAAENGRYQDIGEARSRYLVHDSNIRLSPTELHRLREEASLDGRCYDCDHAHDIFMVPCEVHLKECCCMGSGTTEPHPADCCPGFCHIDSPKEIQACTECGTYQTDTEAFAAHARVCGCNWGSLRAYVVRTDSWGYYSVCTYIGGNASYDMGRFILTFLKDAICKRYNVSLYNAEGGGGGYVWMSFNLRDCGDREKLFPEVMAWLCHRPDLVDVTEGTPP